VLLRLRDRLEIIAVSHITRTALASVDTRVRIRQLEALEHNATRFEEKIVAALSADVSNDGEEVHRVLQPGINPNFLDATHGFITLLRYTIEGALTALRQPTNTNASKLDRDLFWDEALQVWYELGGEPTGGDACDFLIAVSKPVFRDAEQRRTQGSSNDAAKSRLATGLATEKGTAGEGTVALKLRQVFVCVLGGTRQKSPHIEEVARKHGATSMTPPMMNIYRAPPCSRCSAATNP